MARRHSTFLICAALSLVIFWWLLSAGVRHLFYRDSFGTFYDAQAASLLHGHLDVPADCLQGEAFRYHGKSYGYFGIVPALLRIPFVAGGVELQRLTRPFMIVYFAGALAGAYAVLLAALELESPEPREAGAGRTWLLVLNLGLGSSLLFLASRAYVYHEAILSGAAFTLWGIYFALRLGSKAGRFDAALAILFGLLAVHCRPTAGLFSLVFTGLTALATGSTWRTRLWVPVCCAAAVLSFNALSYAKFGTIDGMPLRLNAQYLENPARLAHIQGKTMHLSNLATNAHAYFLSLNATFQPRFPFVLDHGQAALPGALYDLNENILALPYAMPGLVLMSVLATAVALVRRGRLSQLTFLALASALPLAAILLTAVASSYRYTADFVPLLVVLSSFFLARLRPGRASAFCVGAVSLCTVAAIFVNAMLALHYQGREVWGVPPEGISRYQSIEAAANRL